MTILDKLQVGNTVRVNLDRSNDRLNKETIEAINTSSDCTIIDFKITDGKGIGVILNLPNGKEEWFFEDEIQILDEEGNIIEKKDTQNNKASSVFKNYNYEDKFKFNELLNPINFMTWLIFSLKDNL